MSPRKSTKTKADVSKSTTANQKKKVPKKKKSDIEEIIAEASLPETEEIGIDYPVKKKNTRKKAATAKESKPNSASQAKAEIAEKPKKTRSTPTKKKSTTTKTSKTAGSKHKKKEEKVIPVEPTGNSERTHEVEDIVKGSPKLFVLDTNVLLHDPTAIMRFQENDLAVPITVLEEIDQFKRGSDQINFHAREISREIDKLASKGSLMGTGVKLGDYLGHLRVVMAGPIDQRFKDIFVRDTPDNRILSAALKLKGDYPDRRVVFVSKDVSLRVKAHSLGIPTEDYENDKIEDFDKLYTGRHILEHLDGTLIDQFYKAPFEVPIGEFLEQEPFPNAYFILRSNGKSALVRYDETLGVFSRVEKKRTFGIIPRNSEQTFALNALTNNDIPLVTISGKAGTGKTLLALAAALSVRRSYHQVFLARPIVPLSNRDIGYLPGDINDKIGPYMQPLWDNLGVIRSQFQPQEPEYKAIQTMLENDKLTINALAYIRGRSLNKIYFIVDEAQNLTGHEVKTIITRAGEGTKIVFTGDPQQIDSPYLDSRSNGLSRLIDRMKGQSMYAHVTLEKGERSALAELASTIL